MTAALIITALAASVLFVRAALFAWAARGLAQIARHQACVLTTVREQNAILRGKLELAEHENARLKGRS